MKKYVLSTLVCGVACSAGFADAAPRKTLSDYSTPPSNIIKDAELMINAEYTAIDYDKGDAVPDHLYGFRVDWRRNFAIEQKSFWNAGISLGYAQGSEHDVDVSHLTLNLGIDYNIAVGQRTYFFVGTRIGMNQIETKFKDEESTTTNRAQMGQLSDQRRFDDDGICWLQFCLLGNEDKGNGLGVLHDASMSHSAK